MSIWTDFAGCESRFVKADGVRTRVVSRPALEVAAHDVASQRPVLWLHGRGGHLETFRYNLPALAARPCVAVDLLGHGLTEAAGSTYAVKEIADHVRAVIDVLDDGHGFDLVGQSLGAWAGLLAARSGAPLHALVLIEPAGLQAHHERMADARVQQAFAQGGQAFAEPTTHTVRLRFAQLLHDPATVDEEMVELRRRLYAQPGAAAVHQAVRAADNEAAVLSAADVGELGRPITLIRGAHGHIPLATYEQVAHAAVGSQVHTIPAAKQWPHYEQPAHVNRLIAAAVVGEASNTPPEGTN